MTLTDFSAQNSAKPLLSGTGGFQAGGMGRGSFQAQQGGFNQKSNIGSQQSGMNMGGYNSNQSMYGQQQMQQQNWGQASSLGSFRPPLPMGGPPPPPPQNQGY